MSLFSRRYELLNYLIKKNNYSSYLEIGVDDPCRNFDAIKVDNKLGVDPAFIKLPKGLSFRGTSDEFFRLCSTSYRFDIIFIDGLHEADQVYRDIENSFKVLTPGGTVVMHDCLPRTELEQHVPRKQDVWTGDVWKAFIRFREDHQNVNMRVVNMDMGMGILTASLTPRYFEAQTELIYINFQKYYKDWMNVISVEEFLLEDESNIKTSGNPGNNPRRDVDIFHAPML